MVNVVIATYQAQDMDEIQIDASMGNVAFGCGKDQWAFSLSKFARIYSTKFGIDSEKMMKKFWGDHFFDLNSKKWST
jgi:elongation factor 2